MDKKWNVYLLLFPVFLFSVCAGAQQTPVKIAIVADKAAGLDKSPLVSLLEARLSQKQGIELLERAAIDKILQEQQLSLAGLLERNAIIEAGRLLRADAFILLSQESSTIEVKPTRQPSVDELDEVLPQSDDSPKGQLIRVRVAETAHGLRLLDRFEELDASKLEEVTERIVKEVSAVVSKLNLPAGEVIPIGIVDIHRVQLGERYRLLERALPVLLSVRLSKEPRIIILEREDLKTLLDEKLLTEGKDTDFWGSAILIDGYLQPKDGGLEMELRLRRAGGNEIKSFAVPLEPNEPSLAIDKAANEIVKQLQDSPPSIQWQPELEAQEFYRQGAFLLAHERYSEAVIPLETAHALQPVTLKYTSELFKNEWQSRCSSYQGWNFMTLGPSYYSDLELAELVSRMVLQIRREYERSNSITEISRLFRLDNMLGTRLGSPSYFTNFSSVSSEQVKQINRTNRRIWVETLDKLWRQQRPKGITFAPNRAHLPWIGYDDPNELIANLKKVYTEVLFPPEMGGLTDSDNLRCSACERILDSAYYYRSPKNFKAASHLSGSDERIISLWNEYLDELLLSSDPIVKFYACTGHSCWLSNGEPNDLELAVDYCNKALDILMNGPISYNDSIRRRFVNRMKEVLPSITKKAPDRLIGILENVLNPLIVKKDIAFLAMWDPDYHLSVDRLNLSSEAAKQYYELFERLALVLQTQSNSSEINRVLLHVRGCQASIRMQYPHLDLSRNQSNLTATMLLSRKDCPDGLRIDLSPLRFDLNDNRFWVILGTWGLGNPNPDGTQTWSSVASLRSIDLTRKAILTTWQGEISFKNGVRLTSIVSSNDAVYVSTYGGGLLEFRKNYVGGQEFIEKPKILTRDNSVPSVFITDMIGEGSRLRIAYGGENKESGLGLYDPETGNWETVFCSSLKGDTPFNAGQPYCINSLTRVNPNKLFFIASGIEQSGFWKMDTISKELKYLGPVGSSTITRFDDIVEALGEKILIKSISSLVEFDTDSEEMKVIYGDHRVLRVEFLRKNINPPDYENMLKPTLLRGMTFGPYYVGHIDLSTSTFHNNKLWARLGESQIIIVGKGESLEEARIIDNDILDGEPVSRFVSTPYGLVAIGNGTVGLIDTK